ncbi:MAG: CRISPR-associated protein Cas4 [Paludibacteraceae bacterium]|nr:CRISPR-associated protein Cas4 [Paludibacteraceae bacterium]
MQITGTHFSYFLTCKRKLWLFANGINMEQNSDLVSDGKLIHEMSYPQRSERYEELEIDGIKIDYYDAGNKIVHEIKRSDKIEKAHEWQVKYYIYVLEQNGIEGVRGVLEYPTLRKTNPIILSEEDKEKIEDIKSKIETIINQGSCPQLEEKNICRNCSYCDFCLVNESDDL